MRDEELRGWGIGDGELRDPLYSFGRSASARILLAEMACGTRLAGLMLTNPARRSDTLM